MINLAQGEVRIVNVNNIPDDLPETNDFIVGHSETGHNHVLVAEKARLYEDTSSGMRVLYALLDSPGEVIHERSFDRHETQYLPPGMYKFTIDREFDHYAEMARKVAD